MGRKGVSKRKPKKSETSAGATNKANGSAVQSLVKDKGAPTTRDGMKLPAGSNKSQKKL